MTRQLEEAGCGFWRGGREGHQSHFRRPLTVVGWYMTNRRAAVSWPPSCTMQWQLRSPVWIGTGGLPHVLCLCSVQPPLLCIGRQMAALRPQTRPLCSG